MFQELLTAAQENRFIPTEGAKLKEAEAQEIIDAWEKTKAGVLDKRKHQIEKYILKNILSRVIVDMSHIKQIPIKEFAEFGYLQEVNRLFFHPLGLALIISENTLTGEIQLAGIQDAREDKEGIIFGCAYFKKDTLADMKLKQYRVQKEWRERADAREKALGFALEPVRGAEIPQEEPEPENSGN